MRIVEERIAMMDRGHGEHDARVALEVRAASKSDRQLRWELPSVERAPYAYAVAYLDTVLLEVTR